jgi:hypothetical protein
VRLDAVAFSPIFVHGLVQMDEQTGLEMRVVALEERVAKLAAIIQILLESIHAGNAHDVVAELYDVIEEDFEQPLQ